MSFRIACTAAFVTAMMSAAGPTRAFDAFFTTQDYLKAPEDARLAFVAGVFDGIASIHDAGLIVDSTMADIVQRGRTCVSEKNMTVNDLDAIFLVWLQKDPKEWINAPASSLYFALDEFCGGK
jgi:hypothetical protein